jgi:hypothetical protein
MFGKKRTDPKQWMDVRLSRKCGCGNVVWTLHRCTLDQLSTGPKVPATCTCGTHLTLR